MTIATGAQTLTVDGTVTCSATNTQTISVSTGQTIFADAAGLTWANCVLTITNNNASGSANFTGLLTQTSGTIQNTTTAGTINFNGGYSKSGGTFTSLASESINFGGSLTVSSAAVVFNASSTQNFITNSATITPTANITFGNLTVNPGSGKSVTLAGNLLGVAGNLLVSTGTYDLAGFTSNRTAAGGTLTVSNGATLSIGGTNSFPTNYSTHSLGSSCSTVSYAGTAQTVSNESYGNLSLSGSGTKTMPAAAMSIACDFTMAGTASATAGGAMTITGNVLLGSGTTLSAGTFGHSVGGNFTNNGATFNGNTSTFTFDSTTAGQTIGGIASTTFNNLTINDSGQTTTLGVNTVVAGNLSVSAGTLDLSTFTANRSAAGGTLTVSNGATLSIGGTNGFPTNYSTHSLGNNCSTVSYAGTAQTVSNESYGNLTLSGSGTKTMPAAAMSIACGFTTAGNVSASAGGALTVGLDVTLGSGTTFTAGAFTHNVGRNFSNNGAAFTSTGGTFNFNGSTAQAIGGTSSSTFNKLSINNSSGGVTLGIAETVGGDFTISTGTFDVTTNNYALSVGGNFSNGGTFTARSGTVTLNGTAAQAISGASTTSFSGLTISNTSAAISTSVNFNVSGTLNMNGSATVLTPSSGVVINSGGAAGTLSGAGKVQVTQTGASGSSNFANQYKFSTYSMTAGPLTVEYTGAAAQDVSPQIGTNKYGNLIISNTAATLTAASSFDLGGTLNMNGANTVLNPASGTVINNGGASGTITGSGTLQVTRTTSTADFSNQYKFSTNTLTNLTVEYKGTAAQTLSALTYGGLKINNSSGLTLSGGNATVGGTLTLTQGNIDANTNNRTVIISSTGTVSRTSGHVIGNLQKNIPAPPGAISVTYEVGDASAYAPVQIDFTNVTTAGNLTAKATAGLHSDIVDSGIDPTQTPKESVNRYWTATNGGVVFTNSGGTASVTLTYANGDLDPALDLTTVAIGKADSCTPPCSWIFPTLASAATSTIAKATGLTSFSDFGVGRRIDHFTFSAPSSAAQNSPFSVTITAVDKNGSTVTGFSGTATITSANGNCTISAGSPTGSFSGGVYTGNVTISNSCSDTLKATQVGNSAVIGTSVVTTTVISSFNAFETSTAANAVTGQIYTKLVGIGPFGLDVVAIANGAQATGFSGNVKVELLANSSPGSNYAANNCPNSNSVIQTIATFALSGGRSTVSLSAVATAYRDVRVRVSYPTSSPTLTSCSTDSFSIRPTGFTVSTSTATNTATSGSPAIKTGGSFDLSAASVTGYDGTPSINNTKVVGSPNAGSIGGSFGAAPSGTGTATGAAFTYSEVGNFGLNANAVYDTTFTSIDQSNDCTNDFSNSLVSGKYGCNFGSAAIAQTTGSSGFGRFIPDNFNVTLNAPSLSAACGTFGYVGQGFSYGTAPVMTVTARNGAGLGNATTTNYAGAYLKLTNATLTPATQGARYSAFDALGGGATPSLDTSGLPAPASDPTIGTFTNGVGTLTFSSGSGLAFLRSTTTPNAPFNADIALSLNVIDTDSIAYASNPASFGAATSGNGISFSGGKAQRFGRLRILGATGVATLPLDLPLRAEYWNGTGFALNTLDSCTSIARANVVEDAYKAPLAACDTIVSTTPATLSAGLGRLRLSAPAGTHTGSVNLTPQLGATASGNFCNSAGGSETAASAAIRSYLQGAWTGTTYDKNPSARAAFGTYGAQPRNFIFFRENY